MYGKKDDASRGKVALQKTRKLLILGLILDIYKVWQICFRFAAASKKDKRLRQNVNANRIISGRKQKQAYFLGELLFHIRKSTGNIY